MTNRPPRLTSILRLSQLMKRLIGLSQSSLTLRNHCLPQ